MGHAPVMVALEQEYYYILIWGAVISLVKACFGSYFAGIGETRVVMIADTMAVALNIPLTYMFIFGVGGLPSMGIAGAAWATIISTLLGVGLFLVFYLAAEHRQRFFLATSLVLDRGIMHRYVRLGLPSGIEMFLNVAAFNLFMLMFQSYGIVEAASAAIVLNWDIVSFIPMIGLNVALISLVGRYIGEGDLTKVRQVIICGFMMGFGYSGLLATLFAVQRVALVQVFLNGSSEDAAILALSSPMMLGLATYAMADAVLLVVGGVLRGAGDTRWMMWMSVTLHWLMLLAQYLVIKVFQLTPLVSWSVFVLMILVTAAVYLWRIQGQAWRSEEAIAKVMAEH